VTKPGSIIANSVATQRCFNLAERVSRTDVSVLISGESGTGKEVVARFIHDRSSRANGAFIAINCAAIPEQMLEAVLFGHEKGAFTGAHQMREGKFELAHGGTLLLDEISEMPVALQAKLLRVLQERELERVGGKRTIAVDVRVIATTNRDLKANIAAGAFREDLFYRLSVFPLQLEPLRARRHDIAPLAEHFLAKHGQYCAGASLSPAALDALTAHDWPGNVRELENVIQRALVLWTGEPIEPIDLGFESLAFKSGPVIRAAAGERLSLDERMLNTELEIVTEVLRDHRGRRDATARALGISVRTLRHKLKRWREMGLLLDRESRAGHLNAHIAEEALI
jgi:two-component system, response regulator FlrC